MGENGANMIKTKQEIREISESLREKGKKIVTTNGVFDILHIGHIESFQKAKEFGDILIVGLNSNKSVKICLNQEGIGKNKVIKRPIVDEHERAKMIAALGIVDYVVTFDEPDPKDFLESVKPNFHIKGKDWEGKRIPEMDVLEKYGGEMKYIDMVPGHSTTNIISKIIELYKEK